MGNIIPSWLVDTDAFQETENATFDEILWVSLYGTLAGLVFLGVFQVKRWRDPDHFCVKPERRPPDPPPPQEGAFSLVRALMRVDEAEFLRRAGLDALVFLRMYLLAAKIMLLFLPYAFFAVLPVNWTGEYYLLAYGTQDINNYTRMSMSNMEPGSPSLWTHVVGVTLLTGIALYLMDGEFSAYTRLRHIYLQKPAVHLRTVFLDDLPQEMRSPSLLFLFFHSIYPNQVARVTISLDTRELSRPLVQRDAIVAKLERVLVRKDKEYIERCCPNRLLISLGSETEASLREKLDALNAEVEALKERAHEAIWEERDFAASEAGASSSAAGGGSLRLIVEETSPRAEAGSFRSRRDTFLSQARALNERLTGSQAVSDSPSSTSHASLLSLSAAKSAPEAAERWAFITFKTFSAATVAQQVNHSTGEGSGELRPLAAPEPRDLYWRHANLSRVERKARRLWADIFLVLLSVFWVVPVTLCYIIFSPDALKNTFPSLGDISNDSVVVKSLVELIYPVVLMGVMSLLPPIIRRIGIMEGGVCESAVQSVGFARYYFFQVVNVFLVTTLAGTVFDTLALILDDPKETFTLLGESLPQVAGFFTEYIVLKMVSGLPWELCRLSSAFLDWLRKLLFPQTTERDRNSEWLGMRPYRDAGWFNYLKVVAQDLLVVLVAMTYANVNPFITIVALLYFISAYGVYKHQLLYVYSPSFESGGALFPKIFRRFVFAIVVAQATMIGVLLLKEAFTQAGIVFALLILTIALKKSFRKRYESVSSCLPMELARRLDGDEELLAVNMDREAYIQPDLKAPVCIQPQPPAHPPAYQRASTSHDDKPYVALRDEM